MTASAIASCMKKARPETGFFVGFNEGLALGAEAQYAGKEGLSLPEGRFIGGKGLRARKLNDQPAMHTGLTERQKCFRHIQRIARV